MLEKVVLVDACRSANARASRGSFVHKRIDLLAAEILKALLDRNPQVDPWMVEDVRIGSVVQGHLIRAGGKGIAGLAGLPDSISGSGTNRQCGSSMDTFQQVAAFIAAGQIDIGIAMGADKMARTLVGPSGDVPGILRGVGETPEPSDAQLRMEPDHDEVYSRPFPDYILRAPRMVGMPQTAQNIAEIYEMSREELDVYAYKCHMKAAKSAEAGKFKDEIVPVKTCKPLFNEKKELIPDQPGEEFIFAHDECIRPTTTPEALAKLPPLEIVQSYAPGPEEIVITAGNSCPTNDSAVAVLLMSESKAEELGLEPMARIKSMAVAGTKPQLMGLGPIPATKKALAKAGLSADDIDVCELNEAFASQAMACINDIGLNPDDVNVNGGALALGHPLGQSGSRLMTTLAHEMKRRSDVRYGLATMCIG
ncbi:MAG: thiolase family protein, partial [Candidatus Hydrogenedentota bacterium]